VNSDLIHGHRLSYILCWLHLSLRFHSNTLFRILVTVLVEHVFGDGLENVGWGRSLWGWVGMVLKCMWMGMGWGGADFHYYVTL